MAKCWQKRQFESEKEAKKFTKQIETNPQLIDVKRDEKTVEWIIDGEKETSEDVEEG